MNGMVGFGVWYCTCCFGGCAICGGCVLPLVVAFAVRWIFVNAGWYAPKNHALSCISGPPREPPGSTRSLVSLGYVQYSAAFEFVNVSRMDGLFPQGWGELSSNVGSVLPVVAPALDNGTRFGRPHVPCRRLPW